jgi:glycosyltransferase involved in cell wall biosynthesis
VSGGEEKRLADVAVIVPCFNHGEFVGEAVESALSQDAGTPRVVVVDDGSTDPATRQALVRLPREVKVIRQENAGQASARNAGARATSEPYLLMLDADDRLPPGALGALRDALIADERAAYAYGVMCFFGAWSGEVRFPPFDPYRMLYRSIVGWLGLVRREAFDQVGGYDTGLSGFEDWDIMLGFLEAGWSAAGVDEVVLEYRKHDTSSLEDDRGHYRTLYRQLRERHAALYARAPELAKSSDLGPAGRLAYRTWWAWRPLPAAVERRIYSLLFRG